MSQTAGRLSQERASRMHSKQPYVPPSLLGSPSAPGAAQAWDAVLRCHSCSGRFTARNLPLKRIALVPQIAPCPHCSARASAATNKLHQIVDLRRARD